MSLPVENRFRVFVGSCGRPIIGESFTIGGKRIHVDVEQFPVQFCGDLNCVGSGLRERIGKLGRLPSLSHGVILAVKASLAGLLKFGKLDRAGSLLN